MEQIRISTATPPYPNELWRAAFMSAVPVSGIGREQKSVFRTTGQVDVNPMADHDLGTTAARVRTIKEAALPRGVPR